MTCCAVGDRRARRPGAVVLVRAFVRLCFARRLLPDDLAVLAVDRHHHVPVHAAARQAAARRMRGRRHRRRRGPPSARRRRSPQTTGDAEPRPGISTFQRTFFVSLHSVGGFADCETPVHLRPAPLRPEFLGRFLRRQRRDSQRARRRARGTTTHLSEEICFTGSFTPDGAGVLRGTEDRRSGGRR